MPYIKPEDRPEIDKVVAQFPGAMSPGEVAYAITRLIMNSTLNPTCYREHALLIGVLETVQDEFKARLVQPYEDWKRQLNGDAF
jgi:hypothetical protein